MLATPHLLVGGACGILSDDQILAFISGLVSHMVLDSLPHHDYKTHFKNRKLTFIFKTAIVFEFVLGVSLLYLFLKDKPGEVIWLASLGALGGIIVDILDHVIGDHLFTKLIWKNFRKTPPGRLLRGFHNLFHTHTPRKLWLQGLLPQLSCIIASLIAMYFS